MDHLNTTSAAAPAPLWKFKKTSSNEWETSKTNTKVSYKRREEEHLTGPNQSNSSPGLPHNSTARLDITYGEISRQEKNLIDKCKYMNGSIWKAEWNLIKAANHSRDENWLVCWEGKGGKFGRKWRRNELRELVHWLDCRRDTPVVTVVSCESQG